MCDYDPSTDEEKEAVQGSVVVLAVLCRNLQLSPTVLRNCSATAHDGDNCGVALVFSVFMCSTHSTRHSDRNLCTVKKEKCVF